MKSYKIKSFIYFLLFVAAAFFYNEVEQEKNFKDHMASSEVVDIDMEQHEDSNSEEADTPLQ